MNNLKDKLNIFLFLIITIITPVILNILLNSNKKITIISIITVLISFISYQILNKEREFNFQILTNHRVYLFFLFLIAFITQNVNLNFETLDWDIHSYLVVAMDIDRGNIPLENQWESKGPLLFYLYNFILKIGNYNFVYFKILNDFILFLISSFLFFSIYKVKNKNPLISFLCSALFLILMSQTWAQAEYSEIYSLLFISCVYCIFFNFKVNTRILFIISLLISFSTLINQGTILFLLGFLIFLIISKQFIISKNVILSVLSGLAIPHLFFLFIYFRKDLFSIYKATFFDIPIGYTSASLSSIRELSIFLRSYFNHDLFLYITIIFIIASVLISLIMRNIEFPNKTFFYFVFINLFISLMFYFIGSHNYYHHLFFLLYFLSFLPNLLKKTDFQLLILSLVFFSVLSVSFKSFENSFNNLKNVNNLLDDYPLYQASQMIDQKFERDYTILALDYVAILHYLNKPNYSYIVHPSNHFEPYISEALIKSKKIRPDEVNKLISENPDIILCSGRKIMSGEIKNQEFFNCEISDWKKNYLKLDTSVYKENKNLNYYHDPYRPIDIFVNTNP